jgi:Ca-activated chloride channel family protein
MPGRVGKDEVSQAAGKIRRRRPYTKSSIMAFAHPLWLILLVAPLAWLLYDWRRTTGKPRLILKVLSIALIVAALAEPRLDFDKTKVAVAVLADTSASVTQQDLQRASDLATQIETSRGSNVTQVIPFARNPRQPLPSERRGNSWNFQRTSGDAGRATSLERAVSEAVASLPAGLIRRVVLISDGNENTGSIVRATWQAQQLGIPIDTYALNGRVKPGLRLDTVSLPGQVFSGEKFPVDLTIESPAAANATVEITAEGKSLGSNPVQLQAGENRVRVRASLKTSGAIDLAGKVTAAGLGDARFEQAVTVRRARALLLSQDPAGTDEHLTNVLDANQFDFDRSGPEVARDLSNYQLLIFNNINMDAIPVVDQARIEDFEKQGGGVLWIAGERNIYTDKKGAPETPIERTFPAKLAPPRTPEGTCVILIIDKSSSMEGKKMDLARAASIGVVQNLRPIDLVGVLIFDNSFQWAVPVRKAEDRSLIARLISGITPDGGTQIAPALAEAYNRIHTVNAVYKHIVLLTDGISEEGDSLSLSKEAAANQVTISTVGLGQDVNRAYLEKVAEFANGKSYFLNDPSGLEQILLKDVQEHTGTTAVEKPLKPVVADKADLLDGVEMETAPVLLGYVRFQTKPGADQLLTIDRDPLFIRWQNGLGRSAVFASDAKSRWSANWVSWPGFDKFWSNVVRDLLPHAPPSEAVAGYDAASGAITVNYRLGKNVEEPAVVPDIFVFGPDGFRQPVKVLKTSAGNYRGELIVGQRQGLFRIRPLNETRAFPEVGIYREEAELSDFGSNQFLLKSIASSTGGRFNPPVKGIFENGGRSIESTMEMWPGLLGLATLLNLVELVMRKWKGLVEALRLRRASPARA